MGSGGLVERLAKGEEVLVNLSYAAEVPPEERDPGASPFLAGAMGLLLEKAPERA